MSSPSYWFLKSEPSAYSWSQLQVDQRTAWTGIRNFEARNNLRAMKSGDLALFYHSGEGKEIVGVARVVSEAGADPTAPGEDWSAVDLVPVAPLKAPVPLSALKEVAELKDVGLVKRGRLSVGSVTAAQFKKILALGKTSL